MTKSKKVHKVQKTVTKTHTKSSYSSLYKKEDLCKMLVTRDKEIKHLNNSCEAFENSLRKNEEARYQLTRELDRLQEYNDALSDYINLSWWKKLFTSTPYVK